MATGLAVTGAGGDVLFVEASLADPETGASGLTLTGQLGDVMKESAQIALSYLRSHGAELELPVGDLKERGVHLHVPAGAVPKDGPSAGVTMTTALASLLSGRQVRTDVAMTGEVSLTGRVLPIGGVKQKLLAAHRAGVTTVIIPKRNEPDLDDVPDGGAGRAGRPPGLRRPPGAGTGPDPRRVRGRRQRRTGDVRGRLTRTPGTSPGRNAAPASPARRRGAGWQPRAGAGPDVGHVPERWSSAD